MNTTSNHQDHVVGLFAYVSDSTKSSLFRNGKVRMKRDQDGNDSAAEGIERSRREMKVGNGRAQSEVTLARNGFELRHQPIEGDPDFFNLREVAAHYYPQCERIVEAVTGGRAFAFDHNVRSALGNQDGRRIAGGQQVQQPLHLVHGDYTLASAPRRLRELAAPPTGNDTLRDVLDEGQSLLPEDSVTRALADGGRFAIINVWRNIATEPVATHPLALCDGKTVSPEDLVVFEIHYPDRIGENYFAKHSPRHRWLYYPAMTHDEALLIKQWDSHGPLALSSGESSDASEPDAPATFSFHSAFDDPSTPPDAPDRTSIEVRCVVLYD